MRAAVTQAHGDRSQLRYVTDYPDPIPGPDDVVIRVAACAVNYHDVFTRRGMPGITIPLPVIVGSDMAGEIAAVGGDVTAWRVGDRVLVDPVIRTGPRYGMIGEIVDGGRAEFVKVPAALLTRVPDNVALEDAAALPLAYGTARRMMITRGRVAAGERVLILGASGGVGVACVQLAKLLGAEVIACSSSATKLERLRTLGADHVVDYTGEPLEQAVRALVGKPRTNGSGGVDVAINFTGGDTWVPTQKCVRLGGRVLTCGATAGFDVHMDMRYLWTFEQELIGSDGWSMDDLVDLMSRIGAGQFRPVIDKMLPLAAVAEAERLLEDREVFGKVLLRP